MKAYLHPDGHHSRTQADAKANGQPFEMIDIPTDHVGLIAYINGVRAAPVGLPEPGDDSDPDNFERTMSIGRPPGREASQYQNGEPTTVFMGSRDPAAIFTCTQCGHNNRNP